MRNIRYKYDEEDKQSLRVENGYWIIERCCCCAYSVLGGSKGGLIQVDPSMPMHSTMLKLA